MWSADWAFPSPKPVRTAVDSARQLPLVEAVVAVDLALHSRIVSLADLCSAAACATGWPGISQARRVIEMAEPAAFHLR
jgi:hypothetical protein